MAFGHEKLDVYRADIYSLGVVFYEMLTGELPMGRFASPSQKVQIDVRLDDVVLKALEKEPEHFERLLTILTQSINIAATARGYRIFRASMSLW